MLAISEYQKQQLAAASLKGFEKRAMQHLREIFPEKFDNDFTTTLTFENNNAEEEASAEIRMQEYIDCGYEKAQNFQIYQERQVILLIDLLVAKGIEFPDADTHLWAKNILEDEELNEQAKVDFVFENLKIRGEEELQSPVSDQSTMFEGFENV